MYFYNYVWGQMLTTYCGDHFTVYTNIEPLCCTPETNVILCINYTSIKKILNVTSNLRENDDINKNNSRDLEYSSLKKNKVGGLTLPDFKTYYKSYGNQITRYWYKHK